MPRGVPGRLDDLGLERAHAHDIVFLDLDVEAIDPMRVLFRADDAGVRKPRLQLGNALRMIGVVMCDQNVRERPAVLLERGENRAGFRGVDGGRGFRGWVVNENTEVVGQAVELKNFGGHGSLPNAMGTLARFPLGRNRPSDKKSRQMSDLERILIAKVCNFCGIRSSEAPHGGQTNRSSALAGRVRVRLWWCVRGRSSEVERQLPKLNVVGSIPIARSIISPASILRCRPRLVRSRRAGRCSPTRRTG